MPYKKFLVIFSLFSFLLTIAISSGYAVTLADYELAMSQNQKSLIKGISQGDGKDLDTLLYKPAGEGPFPALVALHGAGGIFPYQLWWAKEISKWGYVVLFVDHYCSRGHLCEHAADDASRGDIMRNWQMVSLRQRAIDAAAAHIWLSNKSFVKKNSIGLIGWSWGGIRIICSKSRKNESDHKWRVQSHNRILPKLETLYRSSSMDKKRATYPANIVPLWQI